MTAQLRTLPVSRIRAENFRSFNDVSIPLSALTVLVGPNGSGKSNVLKVLQFISSVAQFDVQGALGVWGGFDAVQRQSRNTGPVRLLIEGSVTEHASLTAPDSYSLRLNRLKSGAIRRDEEFEFKRLPGRGRRIKVSGAQVTITATDDQPELRRLRTAQTSGLGTLARLDDSEVGPGPSAYMQFLTSIRMLEPNVDAARQPARMAPGPLAGDAHNLSSALLNLQRASPSAFDDLLHDLKRCLPGLSELELVPIGGSTTSVVIRLRERGLTRSIDLADASFGTVRLLALLTALHEPSQPAFTAIEEVDHGLHPYALEVLIARMRDASERTQILAATHSPSLVNRLSANEIIVCDRDPETSESVIPARSAEEIQAAIDSSDMGPGELWFAGALGGVPDA